MSWVDVSTLKSVAQEQEQSLASFKTMKEEISSSTNEKLQAINELIEVQKGQAETLHSTVVRIKDEVSEGVVQQLGEKVDHIKEELLREVDGKLANQLDEKLEEKLEVRFKQIAQASHFQTLREQAFNKRLNLVISGLAEDEQKSTSDLVLNFLETTLNVKKAEFTSASRMGPPPIEQQAYSRPILVSFRNIYQRNRVWRKRQGIAGDNDEAPRIRITADLPKELKEGIHLLYRVAEAASKLEQFQSAKVFNYQLELDGKIFLPSQLEELPEVIRPSTLASPRSETALAFFTKRSVLSNHFPSEFNIGDEKFYSVEQYLAVRRATFSNHPEMLRKAQSARDPRQAKYVLNTLKEDRAEEWYEGIEEVLTEGLRAKFSQNLHLRSFLINTNQLLLGEASKDPRWGVGMSLDNPEILNSSLWIPGGNLLGRCLMKIRAELPWSEQ